MTEGAPIRSSRAWTMTVIASALIGAIATLAAAYLAPTPTFFGLVRVNNSAAATAAGDVSVNAQEGDDHMARIEALAAELKQATVELQAARQRIMELEGLLQAQAAGSAAPPGDEPAPAETFPPPQETAPAQLGVFGDVGMTRENDIWRLRIANALLAQSPDEVYRVSGNNVRAGGVPIAPSERAVLVRVALQRVVDQTSETGLLSNLSETDFQLLDVAGGRVYDPFWAPPLSIALARDSRELWLGFVVPESLTRFSLKFERLGVISPLLFNLTIRETQ